MLTAALHHACLRWEFKRREPLTTFFDAAGKPAAVLVGHFSSTGTDLRSVLYARDVPGLSVVGQLRDMAWGQVYRTVDKTKTMEDGTVMHAVGIIRRMYMYGSVYGDNSPFGLFRVDPETGQFNEKPAEMQCARMGYIKDIVNGKKELIAYSSGFGEEGKVFVAAGVDAVLVVALFAAMDMNVKTWVTDTRVNTRGGMGVGS